MQQVTRLFVSLTIIILLTLLIVFFSALFKGERVDVAISSTVKENWPLLASAIIILLFQKWLEQLITEITKFLVERLYPYFAGFKKYYLKKVREYYLDFDYHQYGSDAKKIYPNNLVYEPLFCENKRAAKDESVADIWTHMQKRTSTQAFVITGKPGSGKSTLLKDMMLSCASSDVNPKSTFSNFIPLYVEIKRHFKKIIEKDEFTIIDLANRVVSDLGLNAPRGFFERNIKNGICLVLIDGLDEVPTESQRNVVIDWLDQQIRAQRSTKFVITSRPHGYIDGQIAEACLLNIQSYSKTQVENYIEKWILANEIKETRSFNSGLRTKAKNLTRELLDKLELRPGLRSLADTPLITAMIVTVHVKKARLPGRRVQLYEDLFDVSINKSVDKWESQGLRDDQVMKVWKKLAYHMMDSSVTVLSETEASLVINEILPSTGTKITPGEFLTMSMDLTGLLNENPLNHYSFAHSTFRDYLASLYILDDKANLEEKLINKIGETWWVETIRLYAAATDATNIIRACISGEIPNQEALTVAIDCMIEALTIDPSIREQFTEHLYRYLEGTDVDNRRLASEAILSSKLRWMAELGGSIIAMDGGLIENCEYQLFADEMRQLNRQVIPDFWKSTSFPQGKARKHVTGIRSIDALDFCNWLTRRDVFNRKYRLPNNRDIITYQHLTEKLTNEVQIAYWIIDETIGNKLCLYPKTSNKTLKQEIIVQQLNLDLNIIQRLDEAIKDKNSLRASGSILDNSPDIVAGGGLGSSFGSTAQELKIVHEITKQRRNSDLLNSYLRDAKFYGFDLERYVQIMSTRFLETIKHKSNFVDWLSGNKKSYDLHLEWVESFETCQKTVDNILSIEGFITDRYIRFSLEQLQLALEHLQSRAWAKSDGGNRIDVEHKYDVLRWFARVGIIYFATTPIIVNVKSPIIQANKIHDICESLLVDLVNLEFEIKQTSGPLVGIRLIQEK
jgi:hypothetical protein